jgi:hypothetical protein
MLLDCGTLIALQAPQGQLSEILPELVVHAHV